MNWITPNKKNLKTKSNYGIRIARNGYDAYNCAQNQLLFNSNWPIMQIAKVIAIADMKASTVCEVTDTMEKLDTDTYEVLDSSSTTYETSEPPEGYTDSYTVAYSEADDDEYRNLEANRKYIRKKIDGNNTVYVYPDEIETEDDVMTIKSRSCYVYHIAKKSHGLGFVPFFMDSKNISSVEGNIVLFSVDIATDVDYPYTEKALEIISKFKSDYGIKCTSEYGSRVPGLCSNMFSKLVQAVKTEETTKHDNKNSIWSPFGSSDDIEDNEGALLPYEFYSFMGNSDEGSKIDGGVYYRRDYPFYITTDDSGSVLDATEVAATSFQTRVDTNNSLIVLRSPMVGADYEEEVLYE